MAVLGGQPPNHLGRNDGHHEHSNTAAGRVACATHRSTPSPAPAPPTHEPGLVNEAAHPCTWCDTSDAKFFQSPSGNISCEIDYKHGARIPDGAYCMSIDPPQNVSMNSSGVLVSVCTEGVSCLSNPPQGEPTLPYKHTTGLGPFTCLSEFSGVTCTVGSGRGSRYRNQESCPSANH